MTKERNKCKLLPPDLCKALESEPFIIEGFAICVQELIMNSIDASATEVSVRLNLGKGSLSVEDNGFGITKEDMIIVGQRNCTSKISSFEDLHKLETYGYRGATLAILNGCSSEVQIISKTEGCPTHCRRLIGGKEMELKQVKDILKRQGTVVKVKGLHTPASKEFEMQRLKKIVQTLNLQNFRVAITVRDDVTGAKLAQIKTSNSLSDAFQKMDKFTGNHRDLLQETSSYDCIMLAGVVSKCPHPDTSMQFLFLNKRHLSVSCTTIYEMLHNQMTGALGFDSQPPCSSKFDSCGKDFQNRYGAPLKMQCAKKCPAFIVNISCPWSQYTYLSDTVEFINIHMLEKVLESFSMKISRSLKISSCSSNVGTSFPLKGPCSLSLPHNSLSYGRRPSFSKNCHNMDSNVTSDHAIHSSERAVHSRFGSRSAIINAKEPNKAREDKPVEKFCSQHSSNVNNKRGSTPSTVSTPEDSPETINSAVFRGLDGDKNLNVDTTFAGTTTASPVTSRKRKILQKIYFGKGKKGERLPIPAKKSKGTFRPEDLAKQQDASSSSTSIVSDPAENIANSKIDSDSDSHMSHALSILSITPRSSLFVDQDTYTRFDDEPSTRSVDAYLISESELKSAIAKIKIIPQYKSKIRETVFPTSSSHNFVNEYIREVQQRNQSLQNSAPSASTSFLRNHGVQHNRMNRDGVDSRNKRHGIIWESDCE